MSNRPAAEASDTALDVIINGAVARVAARDLAALLDEQGFGGRKVATALNGAFVPETARRATLLKPGDRIEIVSARQGG